MFFTKSAVKKLSMKAALEEAANGGNIILIDVRTREEYAEGHIPKSINIPLNEAEKICTLLPDKAARLFVYCLSGARSASACGLFEKLGYTDITNIGGINAYYGNVERGNKA